jgi:hypothetical protein
MPGTGHGAYIANYLEIWAHPNSAHAPTSSTTVTDLYPARSIIQNVSSKIAMNYEPFNLM